MNAAAFLETLRALSRSKGKAGRQGVRNLTPSEVRQRWKGAYSAGTLSNWRSSGIGPPYIKLGGRVLYPLKALQEFEAGKLAGATTIGD
ncbi:helix-turn-helix transcriptional regulator [Dyella sp. 2RAF44]|uniref:helix-turn-helix transcriptional regulator n=1 Tax=Dyella sp. 2RAF44 TaxID=3233000 RepID=UPI003F90B9FD